MKNSEDKLKEILDMLRIDNKKLRTEIFNLRQEFDDSTDTANSILINIRLSRKIAILKNNEQIIATYETN